MNKTRIAIICSTNYRTYPMGGMMSFITDLLPWLSKDFEITLWGVAVEGEQIESSIKLHGEEYPLEIFSRVKLKNKILPNIFRASFDLRSKAKLILSRGYDILYFHGIPLSFPFLNRHRTDFSPKIVNHIHGVTNPLSMNKSRIVRNALMINLYNRYRRNVVKNSDLILLASDREAHNSFAKGFNGEISPKIHYIPNFADSEIFKLCDKVAIRKSLNLPIKGEILVNTGRLNIHKDPHLLLQAFEYLINGLKKDALLFLIGDGDLREDLEQRIHAMKMTERVRLLGRLNREEVAMWLNAADVFVYTSFGNGFPISLIEAAMCGIPIVSTDITGIHDLVINGSTGYLALGRDCKDLARKIEMALENKHLLSQNILSISGNFAAENIASKIRNLFHKLI